MHIMFTVSTWESPRMHVHTAAQSMTSSTYRLSADGTGQEATLLHNVGVPNQCLPVRQSLTGVFMRREGEGQIQSQEEQPCGDRSRNQRGSYKLCAEDYQQLPEAGRSRNWSFLEDSGGGKNLPATSLRTLSPQNFGRINFCCLKWPGLQLFVIATLGNEYNICAN